MSNLDPRIEAVRAKYDLARDDFWQIKQNRQWVCKHAALEVVAVKANIEWMPPQIIEKDAANLLTSMIVTGKMGDRVEWATGETNSTNYSVSGKQPAYPWAMSEKRAKDRVVLKLVGIHGLVYSEDEMPSTATEQESKPVRSDPPQTEAAQKPKPLSKANDEARNTYSALVKDMRQCTQADDLVRWWKDLECVELRKKLPQDWQDNLRKEWVELGTELRSKQTEEFPGSGVTDVSGRELNNVEG